jgi:hypothetical protein
MKAFRSGHSFQANRIADGSNASELAQVTAITFVGLTGTLFSSGRVYWPNGITARNVRAQKGRGIAAF